jgi:hypothetical protein
MAVATLTHLGSFPTGMSITVIGTNVAPSNLGLAYLDTEPAAQEADMLNMHKPSIAKSVGDVEVRLQAMPLESAALDQQLGAFNTPLVSAWKVYGKDNSELGFIFEYSHVPKTWSDALVKEHLRRSPSIYGDIDIPQSLLWVRIVAGSGPAFARTREEAVLLFDLDLQLSRIRDLQLSRIRHELQ